MNLVYLAGASAELSRVLRMADLLEQHGAVITHKWWIDVQQHGVGNDGSLTREEQERHARVDLRGIIDADVVFALWPSCRSMGAPFEVGYAQALGKAIVATGSRVHECIFLALADYRDVSDDLGLVEVLRLLDVLARRRT